jgi:hypothetical protein
MKKSYIYVIGSPDQFDLVKIGKSDYPAATGRLQSLQTGNPFGLMVWYEQAVPRNQVLKIEKKLHDKFNSCRKRGEWFKVLPSEVVKAIKEISNGLFEIKGNGTNCNTYCGVSEIDRLIANGDDRIKKRIKV